MSKKQSDPQHERPAGEAVALPLALSVGYQIRMTHRSIQRFLQLRIAPYDVTLGMWYFLRALWEEDGLTQSELSRMIGTSEPTALNSIQAMERAGYIERIRDQEDRRKLKIFLTPEGRALAPTLVPLAAEVVREATKRLTTREVQMLLSLLNAIQETLAEMGHKPEVGERPGDQDEAAG